MQVITYIGVFHLFYLFHLFPCIKPVSISRIESGEHTFEKQVNSIHLFPLVSKICDLIDEAFKMIRGNYPYPSLARIIQARGGSR